MKKQFLSISTGKLCVYTSEPKGLPQLFFVHGGMGLSADSLMPSLAGLEQTFDLVFFDQRGCGESDAPESGSYTLEELAGDLREIVGKLGDKKRPIGVFGHSLGGMVAIKALSLYRDLFDFFFLSNTALDDSWRAASGEAVRRLNDPAIEAASKQFDQEPLRDDLLRELAISYGPLYFPELTRDQAREVMAGFSYRAASVGFTSEKVYPGMDLLEGARKIDIPGLVIAGEKDVVVPYSCQENVARYLCRAGLDIINDAGHFPFVTNKDDFVQTISQWWEGHRKGIE